jgi:hypothetical protein
MDRFCGVDRKSDLRLFVFHEFSPPFLFEFFIREIAGAMGDSIVPAGCYSSDPYAAAVCTGFCGWPLSAGPPVFDP